MISMYEFESGSFKGQLKSRHWIGTHTIVMKAFVRESGIYGEYSSVPIYLTMDDPCKSTQLEMPTNIHSLLDATETGIQNQRTTINAAARTHWKYEEFPDSYAKNYPDVQYELCGPRTHYITVKNKETGVYEDISYPNQFNVKKPYLLWWKYEEGLNSYSRDYKHPLYEFILTTNDDKWIGIYEY
jgi:hypothetical protein